MTSNSMEISCNLTVVQYCIKEYNELKYLKTGIAYTQCVKNKCACNGTNLMLIK